MENKTKDMGEEVETFSVDELEVRESVRIDLAPFEGNVVKIEGIKTGVIDSDFTDSGKQNVLYVWTEQIGDISFGEGKPLKARERYNVSLDENGKPFVSEKSDLAEILMKKGVSSPSQLIGKDVVIRRIVKKRKGSKFPLEFLGFQ